MTYDEMAKVWDGKAEVSFSDFLNIAKAVSQVYPMIVLANLSKNTYTMIRDEGFLCNEITNSGCYDDMIDDNVENIHPNYQELFYECFSRDQLLKNFKDGKTEVYAELYQKNKKGRYQWVSTHVIKIENDSGDIMHICLNRVLDGIDEKRYNNRK
ncbi:MAG: PAS domain-containing protein [Lachnospiraceae bacterium]